jgi:hypothetical protein
VCPWFLWAIDGQRSLDGEPFLSSLLVPRVWVFFEWGTPLSGRLPSRGSSVVSLHRYGVLDFVCFLCCTLTYFSCSCFFCRFFHPLEPHRRNRHSVVKWPCSTASYCALWLSLPCMTLFCTSVAPCLRRSKRSSVKYCSLESSKKRVSVKAKKSAKHGDKGSGKRDNTSLFSSGHVSLSRSHKVGPAIEGNFFCVSTTATTISTLFSILGLAAEGSDQLTRDKKDGQRLLTERSYSRAMPVSKARRSLSERSHSAHKRKVRTM